MEMNETSCRSSSFPEGHRAVRANTGDQIFICFYLLGTFGFFNRVGDFFGFSGMAPMLFLGLYGWLIVNIFRFILNGEIFEDKVIEKSLFLFLMLLVSSVFSYRPIASIGSVSLLFMDYLFAWWCSTRLSSRKFLRIFLFLVVGMTVGAGLVAVLDPALVIYYDPINRANIFGFENIRGLFPHKIHAGVFAGLALAVAVFGDIKNYRVRVFLSAILVFMVGASGSSLSIVAVVIGFGVAALVYFFSLSRFKIIYANVFLFSLVALGLFFYFELYVNVLGALGRDEGMTGRVPVWQFAFNYISENLFFGGGFGVFFADSYDAPIAQISRVMQWYLPPSFHQGYIQLFAESGLVGAVGFMVLFFGSIYRVYLVRDLAWICVLMMVLIANLGASLFVIPRSIPFILLVFSYYCFYPERMSK